MNKFIWIATGAALAMTAGTASAQQQQQPQQGGQPVIVCPAPGQPCMLMGQQPSPQYAPWGYQQPQYAPQQQYAPQPQYAPQQQQPQQQQPQLYVVPVPVEGGQPVFAPQYGPQYAPQPQNTPQQQGMQQQRPAPQGQQPTGQQNVRGPERSSTADIQAQAADGTTQPSNDARAVGLEATDVESQTLASDVDVAASTEGNSERAEDTRRDNSQEADGNVHLRDRHKAIRLRLTSWTLEGEEFDSDWTFYGLGVGFRYYIDDHWGFEVAADTMFDFKPKFRLASVPVSASAMANLFPNSAVDPYVAAGLGIQFHDAPWNDKDDFAEFFYSVGAGIDFDIGKFSMNVEARRLWSAGDQRDDAGEPFRDRMTDGWRFTFGLGGLF